MFKKLYFLYYEIPFVTWTLDWALEDVCKEKNIEYEAIHYPPDAHHLCLPCDTTVDNILVFVIYDGKRNKDNYVDLQTNWPNAKVVQFSADTHYFLNDNFWLADYYIDTMEDCVKMIAANGKSVGSFDWTVSQRMINKINAIYEPVKKDVDFICLCKESTQWRRQFFSQIRKHFSLLSGLNEYSIEKIVEYYARSKFTLGTSSSCMDGENRRSMKGMRDWIGPLCDSLIIYDNFPQIIREWPVPVYKFGDISSLKDQYDFYSYYSDISDNLLQSQKDWLSKNTCDIQLSNIIDAIAERENV